MQPTKRTPRKKPAVLTGLGAFGVTLLALVLGFSLQASRVSASRAAEPVSMVSTAPRQVAPPSTQSIVAEPAPPSQSAGLLADLGITPEQLEAMPRPAANTLLPSGLPTAGPDDWQQLAAVPIAQLTPAFEAPDGELVLALEWDTDLVIQGLPARWTVVGQQPGWLKVMVPVGRGALPSDDPSQVNHHAVWIPEAAVTLEEEPFHIVISISDRLLTIYDGDQVAGQFHVGVGVIGVTDTPLGLCSVVGHALIQTGAESLLTSCQSERIDTYAGSTWATIAIHEGEGFSQATGGAVSNGCVRVSTANFATYLENIRVGTPVIVVP